MPIKHKHSPHLYQNLIYKHTLINNKLILNFSREKKAFQIHIKPVRNLKIRTTKLRVCLGMQLKVLCKRKKITKLMMFSGVFRLFDISIYIKKKTLNSNFEFSISVNKDWSELGVKHQVMMNQNQ